MYGQYTFASFLNVRGVGETGTNSEGAGFATSGAPGQLTDDMPDYQSGALNLSANLPPRVALLLLSWRGPDASHLYLSTCCCEALTVVESFTPKIDLRRPVQPTCAGCIEWPLRPLVAETA